MRARQPHVRFIRGFVARSPESGFSLMEVIVATIIATIAVLGLAYTFGTGRAFINRFETARAALAAAEAQLETLAAAPAGSPDLALGEHTADFVVGGADRGDILWQVLEYRDPADGLATDPRPMDLKRVVVTVSWDDGALADTVRLERLFPAF